VKVTGTTQIFGLFGHPVRHSLSPEMHTYLLQRYEIDAVYVAFDVPPKRKLELASALRTLGIRGVNLTVPFKSAILPDLDEITQAGREAQAVNVVIQHDQTLVGYNTDGEGFIQSLERAFPNSSTERAVTLLGAGGAARAIAASLADLGAPEIRFLNRGQQRAENAVEQLRVYFPKTKFSAAPLTASSFLDKASSTDLIVNCTAAGASDVIATFNVNKLPESAVWCDINYWMEAPPGLAQCAQRDLRTVTGLGMLIHQGLLSFELFTGLPVEPEEVYALLGK
jgi:shikimate dehydrogenase